MAKKIEALIFDLGNVLVSFDHRIAARKILAFTDRREGEIYNLFFDSGISGAFEEGKLAPQDFFLRVKEMLALRLDYRAFLPVFNEIFFLTSENKEVYNLVKKLKKNHKLVLLSNINILHFDYLKEKFPVFDAFHHILASFELKMRKPEPEIYRKAMEATGVSAAEKIFYTDDRPELIEKAALLGIQSFVFKNIEQLKEDLGKAGIDAAQ